MPGLALRELFDPPFHCYVVERALASPGSGEITTRASTARTSTPVTKHSPAASGRFA